MKMDNLNILDQHYDARADGWRVLAKVADPRSPRPFAVGWQPRDPALTGTLHNAKRYLDRDSATRVFKHLVHGGVLPSAKLMTDWQQETLYKWEGDFCYPLKKSVTKEEAEKLIRVVCRDYGMPRPVLVMQPHTDNSEYMTDTHEIRFGHRDNIGLLHELSHAVCDARHADDEGHEEIPPHSPALVWTLIELYHRYAGLPIRYLTISASNRGLTGDFQADQSVPLVSAPGRPERKRPAPRQP